MRYVTDLLPDRPSVGEPDLTLRGMTECGKRESWSEAMAYLNAAGPQDNGCAVVWEQDENFFFLFSILSFRVLREKIDTKHKTEW